MEKYVKKIIFKFTGHNMEKCRSYEDFVRFMCRPVDAASLGVCRMLFGM